jgi:hypothetical protein
VLDFRRVLIVQRRVQEVVATHGGDGRRRRAFSQLMDAMVQLRVCGCLDGCSDARFLGSGRRGAARWKSTRGGDWRCGRRRWSGNELSTRPVPQAIGWVRECSAPEQSPKSDGDIAGVRAGRMDVWTR